MANPSNQAVAVAPGVQDPVVVALEGHMARLPVVNQGHPRMELPSSADALTPKTVHVWKPFNQPQEFAYVVDFSLQPTFFCGSHHFLIYPLACFKLRRRQEDRHFEASTPSQLAQPDFVALVALKHVVLTTLCVSPHNLKTTVLCYISGSFNLCCCPTLSPFDNDFPLSSRPRPSLISRSPKSTQK